MEFLGSRVESQVESQVGFLGSRVGYQVESLGESRGFLESQVESRVESRVESQVEFLGSRVGSQVESRVEFLGSRVGSQVESRVEFLGSRRWSLGWSLRWNFWGRGWSQRWGLRWSLGGLVIRAAGGKAVVYIKKTEKVEQYSTSPLRGRGRVDSSARVNSASLKENTESARRKQGVQHAGFSVAPPFDVLAKRAGERYNRAVFGHHDNFFYGEL